MVEDEWIARWLASKDLELLFDLRGGGIKTSKRKLRLFACGCCRLVWSLLTDETSRHGVEVAEAYADGRVPKDQLQTVHWRAEEAARIAWDASAGEFSRDDVFAYFPLNVAAIVSDDRFNQIAARDATDAVHWLAANAAVSPHLWGTAEGEQQLDEAGKPINENLVNIFRCVFGNPFCPTAVEPSWVTPNALSLATSIYDERAFDRMPILADALEEAGCTSADILTHCRSGEDHVRGCWVLDLVLGKK